jgi:hypothetical protein
MAGSSRYSARPVSMTSERTAKGAGVRPTKLFIGGISSNTSTKVLREHFSEYAQVLDCVAMRKPDGRSRGFGLVTLDSLAAAEHVLAVPQVIDGRVVDMKMAVPDSHGNSMVRGGPSGATHAGQSQPPKWMDFSDPEISQPKAHVALSASAAEFVPLQATAPRAQTRTTRVVRDEDVLVFAEDYVSFLEDQERLCAKKGEVCSKAPRCPPPTQAPPPPTPFCIKRASDAEIATLGSEDCPVVVDQSPAEDLLPKGSALHSSGGCRPCNFFPKGRCGSGSDCTFCHLTHEARKPTRQEKRERQAAWQARQLEATQCTSEKSNDEDLCQLIGALLKENPKQPKSKALVIDESPCSLDRPVTTQVPVAFALNFADYDDSDDDSESETEATAPLNGATAVGTREGGRRWSREEMLRLRVAMVARGDVHAANVGLPSVK